MLDRRAVQITVVATFFAAFLGFRLLQQLNYLPIHICIPPDVAARKPVLTAFSSDGRQQELTPRQENPTVYSMLDRVIPVERVLVSVPDGTILSAESVRVFLGSGWPPPVAQLRYPVLTDHDKLKHSSPQQAAGHIKSWLTAQPFAASGLPAQPPSLNWQGDLWLLLVPLLQSIVSFLLLKLTRIFAVSAKLWISTCNVYEPNSTRIHRVLTWSGRLVTLTLALLILCQIQFQVRSFLLVRDGFQFFITLCILAAVLFLGKRWITFLCRIEKTSIRTLATSLLIGTIFLAKLFWVATVNTSQTDDYGRYFRYGGKMAAGNWTDLALEQTPLLKIFVERSAVYTWPVASLFGQGTSPLAITNVILQTSTAVITALLIARMFGNLAACLSAPMQLLYPSFWYSSTLATPQIPGFFWMSLVWLTFEQLRCLAVRVQHTPCTLFIALRIAALTATLTLWTTILEIQKSLGLFAFLAAGFVTSAGLYNLIRNRKASITRIGSLCLLCGGTIFLCWQTTQFTCREFRKIIAERLPSAAEISVLGYFSSIDSTTNASGPTVGNWRFSYITAVPRIYQTQLHLRKILHEKIGSFNQWICSPVEKSIALGQFETEDHLIKTLGSRSDAYGLSRDYTRVPWLRTQRKLSQALFLVLLFLTLLRLCDDHCAKIKPAEFFPLTFVLLNLLVVLFFAESAPYYLQILAFPMVWSSAHLVANNHTAAIKSKTLPNLALEFGRFLTPLFGILLVCNAIGQAVDSSGWTFLHISAPTVPKHSTTPQLSFSRVHQSLQIPHSDDTLKSGIYEADISILNPYQHSDTLAFLVTADTRSRNLYFPKSHWKSLPLTWSLSCQDKLLASGQLHQLLPPQFLRLSKADFPPEFAAGKLQLSVRLSLTLPRDISLSKAGFVPSVAIEYPFNVLD